MKKQNWRLGFAALVLVGAAFVALGIVRGEPDTVLKKAVLICLECIGLG